MAFCRGLPRTVYKPPPVDTSRKKKSGDTSRLDRPSTAEPQHSEVTPTLRAAPRYSQGGEQFNHNESPQMVFSPATTYSSAPPRSNESPHDPNSNASELPIDSPTSTLRKRHASGSSLRATLLNQGGCSAKHQSKRGRTDPSPLRNSRDVGVSSNDAGAVPATNSLSNGLIRYEIDRSGEDELMRMLDMDSDDEAFAHVQRPGSLATGATKKKPFDTFKALFDNEYILMNVTSNLAVRDIVNLYSVSKTFHYLFNLSYQSYVVGMARQRMGGSLEAFPPTFYWKLCIVDPTHDYVTRHAADATASTQVPRMVPSLRYLGMLEYREKVVSQIILLLAMQNHRLPSGSRSALRKIWFLMDQPTNEARIQLVKNHHWLTSTEIVHAHYVFFKLDMLFTDPVAGGTQGIMRGHVAPGQFGIGHVVQHGLAGRGVVNPNVTARELVFAHRDLRFLWRVLRGEDMSNRIELMQAYIRVKYRVTNPAHLSLSIMGIPPDEIGALGKEHWGEPPSDDTGTAANNINPRHIPYLLPPDELLMREGVRRRLRIRAKLFQIMTFGYLDAEKMQTKERMDMQKVYEWLKKSRTMHVTGLTKKDFPQSDDFDENYKNCVELMKRLLK